MTATFIRRLYPPAGLPSRRQRRHQVRLERAEAGLSDPVRVDASRGVETSPSPFHPNRSGTVPTSPSETECGGRVSSPRLTDVEKVFEYLVALLGVGDFGVPLDAVEVTIGVTHRFHVTDVAFARKFEPVG